MNKILIAYNPVIDGNDFGKAIPVSSDRIVVALSGDETISLCAQNPGISLVILTSNLDNKNSFETAAAVHASQPELPVVMLCDHFSLASFRLAKALGCREVFKYPVEKTEMYAILKKYSNHAVDLNFYAGNTDNPNITNQTNQL